MKKVLKIVAALTFFIPAAAIVAWILGIGPIGFLRSEGYRSLQWPLGICCFILMAAPWLLERTLRAELANLRKTTFFACLGCLAWCYVEVGVPLLVSWYVTERCVIDTYIASVDRSPRKGRVCGGKAKIKVDYDPGLFNEICVSRRFAKSIQPDEQVRVFGRWHTNLGLFVDRVANLQNEEG